MLDNCWLCFCDDNLLKSFWNIFLGAYKPMVSKIILFPLPFEKLMTIYTIYLTVLSALLLYLNICLYSLYAYISFILDGTVLMLYFLNVRTFLTPLTHFLDQNIFKEILGQTFLGVKICGDQTFFGTKLFGGSKMLAASIPERSL